MGKEVILVTKMSAGCQYLLVHILWILSKSVEVSGISCSSSGLAGVSSVSGIGSGDIDSCYFRSSTKLSFPDAKDLCENQLDIHLVFFDSTNEQSTLYTYLTRFKPGYKFWLGVSQVGSFRYWTHFKSNSGTSVSTSDWSNVPAIGQQVIVDFTDTSPGQWTSADVSDLYYALCEGDSTWSTKLSGYISLAAPTTQTAADTGHTQMITADVCDVLPQTSSVPVVGYRFLKQSTGTYSTDYSFTSISLLSCLKTCVQRNCCYAGYSAIEHVCYRLSNVIDPSQSTLDCSRVNCFSLQQHFVY